MCALASSLGFPYLDLRVSLALSYALLSNGSPSKKISNFRINSFIMQISFNTEAEVTQTIRAEGWKAESIPSLCANVC